MKAEEIYQKAQRNGVEFECDCTQISLWKWEELMKGATRADCKRIHKILRDGGHQDPEWLSLWNPYHYYKTSTHLIYVHSGIEHFYRIID